MASKIFGLALLLLSVPVIAGSFTLTSGKKGKDEYKYSKCVEGVFAVSSLKAELTPNEICKYGKKGCSSIKAKEKMTAYCEYKTLSECFENKSWLSIDQILGITLKEKPGLITYGLKKGSSGEGKTCGYWD